MPPECQTPSFRCLIQSDRVGARVCVWISFRKNKNISFREAPPHTVGSLSLSVSPSLSLSHTLSGQRVCQVAEGKSQGAAPYRAQSAPRGRSAPAGPRIASSSDRAMARCIPTESCTRQRRAQGLCLCLCLCLSLSLCLCLCLCLCLWVILIS